MGLGRQVSQQEQEVGHSSREAAAGMLASSSGVWPRYVGP